MKKYEKPDLNRIEIVNSEQIANSIGLANWLEGNELIEHGVTTYVFQS